MLRISSISNIQPLHEIIVNFVSSAILLIQINTKRIISQFCEKTSFFKIKMPVFLLRKTGIINPRLMELSEIIILSSAIRPSGISGPVTLRRRVALGVAPYRRVKLIYKFLILFHLQYHRKQNI